MKFGLILLFGLSFIGCASETRKNMGAPTPYLVTESNGRVLRAEPISSATTANRSATTTNSPTSVESAVNAAAPNVNRALLKPGEEPHSLPKEPKPAVPKNKVDLSMSARIQGDIETKVYYLPGCQSWSPKPNAEKIMFFFTEDAAQANGYKKAENCK